MNWTVPEHYRTYNPTDTNGDGSTTMIDVLVIINHLRRVHRNHNVVVVGMLDANGDGTISAGDAVHIINHFTKNRGVTPTSETESAQEPQDSSEDQPLENSDDGLLENEVDVAIEPDQNDNDETDEPTESIDDDESTDDSESESDPIDRESDGETESESENDSPHPHWLPRFGGGNFFHHVLGAIDSENLIIRLDTNDDGRLNEDEVPAVIWQFVVDREIDTNADGKITVPEIEAELAEFRDEIFDRRFEKRDDNGDGFLTEDEVRDRVWQRISAADTDGDSAVSRDELKTWIEERKAQRDDETEIDSEPIDRVSGLVNRVIRGLRRRFRG